MEKDETYFLNKLLETDRGSEIWSDLRMFTVSYELEKQREKRKREICARTWSEKELATIIWRIQLQIMESFLGTVQTSV